MSASQLPSLRAGIAGWSQPIFPCESLSTLWHSAGEGVPESVESMNVDAQNFDKVDIDTTNALQDDDLQNYDQERRQTSLTVDFAATAT